MKFFGPAGNFRFAFVALGDVTLDTANPHQPVVLIQAQVMTFDPEDLTRSGLFLGRGRHVALIKKPRQLLPNRIAIGKEVFNGDAIQLIWS